MTARGDVPNVKGAADFTPMERYRLRITLGETLFNAERARALIEFVDAWRFRALPSDIAAACEFLRDTRVLLVRRAEMLREALDDPEITAARLAELSAEVSESARSDRELARGLYAACGAIAAIAAQVRSAAKAPNDLAS